MTTEEEKLESRLTKIHKRIEKIAEIEAHATL